MRCTVINDVLRNSQEVEVPFGAKVEDLTSSVILREHFYVTSNGKIKSAEDTLEDGYVYHLVPRLVGGKGGFGSMLRAIGAQIEKTTNHEACRDLSGRRMRDVNNEKKLKDWVGKAAERERERLEKKRERRERRKHVPKHMFHDPKYQEQKEKVLENLDDALRKGLQTATAGTTTKRKKTATTSTSGSKKPKAEWFGVDLEDLSDSDDDDDSDDAEAQPSGSGSATTVVHSSQQDGGAGSSSSSSSSSASESDSPEPAPENESHQTQPKPESNLRKTQPAPESDTQKPENDRVEEKMEINVENQNGSDETTEQKEETKTQKSETESNNSGGLLEKLAESPPKQQQQKQEEKQKVEQDIPEVDLDAYSSAEELESVGLDALKMALVARGVKCGGTLHERAARLYSIKGLTPDQIDPALRSKGGKVKKSKAK